MKAVWDWIGSPAYWRLSAIVTGFYLAIAVLGKTGDWLFSFATLLGFYLCWRSSRKAMQARLNVGPASPSNPPFASPNPKHSD